METVHPPLDAHLSSLTSFTRERQAVRSHHVTVCRYSPLKCIVMEVNHAEAVQEGSILEEDREYHQTSTFNKIRHREPPETLDEDHTANQHTHKQTHAHTHTNKHANTHALSHTHVRFCEKWGLSIGVMVFILYNLYVLLPYTYPTPKLSPHRRLCISTFPKKPHSV